MEDLILALILWIPTTALTTFFYKENMGSVSVREFLWIALASFVPFVNMVFIIIFGGYLVIKLLVIFVNWICRKYDIDLDKKIL